MVNNPGSGGKNVFRSMKNKPKKNDNKSKTNNLTNKQKTKTTLDLQDTNMGLVAGYS